MTQVVQLIKSIHMNSVRDEDSYEWLKKFLAEPDEESWRKYAYVQCLVRLDDSIGADESRIFHWKEEVLNNAGSIGRRFLENVETPAQYGREKNGPLTVFLAAGNDSIRSKKLEDMKQKVRDEVSSIRIQTDKSGIVLKTDTLGSLEAVSQFLQERNVPVRVADVGPIVRRDVIEAQAAGDTDPLNAVILGFNVKFAPDIDDLAAEYGVETFINEVIYRLYDDYNAWVIVKREQAKAGFG